MKTGKLELATNELNLRDDSLDDSVQMQLLYCFMLSGYASSIVQRPWLIVNPVSR